jgi:hypothetical protein
MIYLSNCENVFNGKGFLSNYDSNPEYFKYTPCGFIGLINPLKLYHRVLEFEYHYDICLLNKLIDAKIDIRIDREFVFSDWDNKIYTLDKLFEYIKHDHTWKYVEYVK